MKKYRVFFNEVYSGIRRVDHDGIGREIEAVDVHEAMGKAYDLARRLGARSYRLMEGGKANYKLTAAFASWYQEA
jgi:hypothetical protein